MGTPAAHSLSMFACVSQYSGHRLLVYCAGSTMMRTGTPALNLLRRASVRLSTDRRYATTSTFDDSLLISAISGRLNSSPCPQYMPAGFGASGSSLAVLITIGFAFGYCVAKSAQLPVGSCAHASGQRLRYGGPPKRLRGLAVVSSHLWSNLSLNA